MASTVRPRRTGTIKVAKSNTKAKLQNKRSVLLKKEHCNLLTTQKYTYHWSTPGRTLGKYNFVRLLLGEFERLFYPGGDGPCTMGKTGGFFIKKLGRFKIDFKFQNRSISNQENCEHQKYFWNVIERKSHYVTLPW